MLSLRFRNPETAVKGSERTQIERKQHKDKGFFLVATSRRIFQSGTVRSEKRCEGRKETAYIPTTISFLTLKIRWVIDSIVPVALRTVSMLIFGILPSSPI